MHLVTPIDIIIFFFFFLGDLNHESAKEEYTAKMDEIWQQVQGGGNQPGKNP